MYLLIIIIIFLILVCKFNNKNYRENLGHIDKFPGTTNETVVLIHGYPFDKSQWSEFVEKVGQYHKKPTIITYDLRGCGSLKNVEIPLDYCDDDTNNSFWNLDDFSNDLKDIVDKKSVIVGWGFGGVIAQRFAQMYPKLVKRLIVLQPETGNELYQNWIHGLSAFCQENSNQNSPKPPQGIIQTWLCNYFHITDENICPVNSDNFCQIGTRPFENAVNVLKESNARAILQGLKVAFNNNVVKGWEKVDFPVFFLGANDDEVSPPNEAIVWFDAIRNKRQESSLKIVDGKHYYIFYHLDLLLRLVLQ